MNMDVYRFTDTNLSEVRLRTCTLTKFKFLAVVIMVERPRTPLYARHALRNWPATGKFSLRHEIPRMSVLIPMDYHLYDHLIKISLAHASWSKEYTEYVSKRHTPSSGGIKQEQFDSYRELIRVKNAAQDDIVKYLCNAESEIWIERDGADFEGVSFQRLMHTINGNEPKPLHAAFEVIASHLNKNSFVYVDALSYLNRRATDLRIKTGSVVSSLARWDQRFIMRSNMLAECTSVSRLYTFKFNSFPIEDCNLQKSDLIICNQNHAIFAQQ